MKKFKLFLASAAMLLGCALAFAQNVRVTGVVREPSGDVVAGAAVQLKGSRTVYAMTDALGNYGISVPADGALIVSCLGFKTIEVPVSGRTVLDVTLQPDTEMLDETIVVAYGTTTREAFTGSAAVVKTEDISKHTTSNVANALVGSVPGLQMRGSSGAPGAGSGSLNIRGIVSMYASTNPLVIVDGAPYTASLTNIPQNDIESISVLKDAASAALYGARGAAGVILITTKRGKTRDAQINVDMKFGVNSRSIQDYDVVSDPGAYYEAFYQQFYNAGFYGRGYTPEQANLYANEQMLSTLGFNVFSYPDNEQLIGLDGRLNPKATLGRRYDAENGVSYWLQPDNWTDLAFRNAFRQEYNVSIDGGTDRFSYYTSIGYLNEDGIVEYSGYKRVSARLKADYQARKWLKIGANVGYVHSKTDNTPNFTESGETGLSLFTTLMAPIYPAFVRIIDGSGQVSIMKDDRGADAYDFGSNYYGLNRGYLRGNPLSTNRYNDVFSLGNQLNGTFTVDVDIFPFLKFNATSNVNWGETLASDYENALYGPSSTTKGKLTKEISIGFRTNNVQTLTYNQQFHEHSINVLLGHEYYNQESRGLLGEGTYGFSLNIPELDTFAKKTDASSSTSRYNVEGWFGSLQYNYGKKYYVSASYRRDASSRFAKQNRWGNFWSLGAGWLINHESFLADASWIDLLKLKVSYGQQGNDNIGSYAYKDLYDLTPTDTGMTPVYAGKGNPEITWETTGNFNAGAEFIFWNGWLSGNIDVYTKKTSDLLFWLSLPESAGVRGYYGNVGDIRNTGVEIALQGSLIRTRTVDWSISANLAHNTTKVLKLPESKIGDKGGFSDNNYWWREGGPVYNRFTLEYAGVNEHGLATYWVDENVGGSSSEMGKLHSYTTTNPNEASYYELGSVLPVAFGGFDTMLRVGDFDISATFDYQIGGELLDRRYASLMTPYDGSSSDPGSAVHKDYAKAWSPDNTSSNIPRWQAGQEDQYAVFANSSRFLTDASYLNFQSFTVGYTLPTQLTHKVNIEKLRIYVAGENLCFWSARQGLDPRYSYNGNSSIAPYSPMRTINGGVQITF